MGDDARSCYENTLATINEAIVWFEKTTEGKAVFVAKSGVTCKNRRGWWQLSSDHAGIMKTNL